MVIHIKNIPDAGIVSNITDRELIVILQAHLRGLTTGTRIAAMRNYRRTYIRAEDIDLQRTFPNVIIQASIFPPSNEVNHA